MAKKIKERFSIQGKYRRNNVVGSGLINWVSGWFHSDDPVKLIHVHALDVMELCFSPLPRENHTRDALVMYANCIIRYTKPEGRKKLANMILAGEEKSWEIKELVKK